MYTTHPFENREGEKLRAFLKENKFILLDAVYLKNTIRGEDAKKFAEEYMIKDISRYFISSLKGIPVLEDFDIKKDSARLIEIIRSDYQKYSNLFLLKRASDSMESKLNESGTDNDSPMGVKYKVSSETFDNLENVVNSKEINPCLTLINAYEGKNGDSKYKQQILDFSRSKNIPLVIYFPNEQDKKILDQSGEIIKQWEADCGFVPGNALWDGVLSVIGTQMGFMGDPARDWLFEHPTIRESVSKQLRER